MRYLKRTLTIVLLLLLTVSMAACARLKSGISALYSRITPYGRI